MPRILWSGVLLLPALAGCAATQNRSASVAGGVTPAAARSWQALVTPADRARIDTITTRWTQALAAVSRGAQPRLAIEGPLAIPTAALEQPALSPGPYYCRLLRLGGRAGVATFKPDFCIVGGTAASGLSFTKQGGSNLFGGWLFADGERRQIFLGTTRPRPGHPGPAYGIDATRDVAGVVERVSAFRWRLSLTRAGGDGLLDVYELVPVTPRVPGSVPAVPG